MSGDRIVPLHFFDDSPLWRAFILYSMFVFDHVLDTAKLHASLERLVHREGWWKLGARLRKNRNGELEYHVPAVFSADRPALSYSYDKHSINVTDHTLASRLPRASKEPAVVGNPNDFLSLMRPLDSLHIVSFQDATLVTLYWPHTLFDILGKRALLDAWMLILQGRDDEVQVPYGVDIDPLASLGLNPQESYKLASQRMGTLGLMGYGLGQIPGFFRTPENRMVCVPSAYLKKLQGSAVDQLVATQGSPEKTPFLSEGDVLCAWWSRLAIAHLPRNSTQTVTLNIAYSLRKPLREDLLPTGAYVSNAIGFINVLLSVKDVFERPLSYVASAIRNAISEVGTRTQVEAFFAMTRESSMKLPPFFGNSSMHMITWSNWTKANLFDVDFSAAVEGKGAGESTARPRYIQNNHFGLAATNAFPIIGKDNDGNYWLSGYMAKGHWMEIERLLMEL